MDLTGGPDRWLAALATLSLDRQRWWSRYHLADIPFRLRSRRAQTSIPVHDPPDVVLQIGATFQVRESPAPVVLCCDSNILLAQRARITGYGEAAVLNGAEVEAIAERERRVYDSAAAILTLSDLVKRSFMDDFHLPAERVHTIHGGPNLSNDMNPATAKQAPVNRRGGPPTVLFVGRQFQRKGGDLLLRSFMAVKEAIPDARLLIIGPDRLDESYRVPEGVSCLGFLNPDRTQDRERLAQAYAEADVFCLPTRFEPFGIVFLEAMLYGLPCVGPNAWAVPEIIDDEKTGLLFPAEDERALADCLIRVLRNPDMARRLGDAGRAVAADYFTWPATVERMTTVLKQVVSDNA